MFGVADFFSVRILFVIFLFCRPSQVDFGNYWETRYVLWLIKKILLYNKKVKKGLSYFMFCVYAQIWYLNLVKLIELKKQSKREKNIHFSLVKTQAPKVVFTT